MACKPKLDVINGKPRYTSLKHTGRLGGSVGGLKAGTKLIHVQDHYRKQTIYIPMKEYNRSQKSFRAQKHGVRAVYSSQSVRKSPAKFQVIKYDSAGKVSGVYTAKSRKEAVYVGKNYFPRQKTKIIEVKSSRQRSSVRSRSSRSRSSSRR